MSTKASIKYGDGFHLYTDLMDSIGREPEFKEPVYLELYCLSLEVSADHEEGTILVTVGISQAMAQALGLTPPTVTAKP